MANIPPLAPRAAVHKPAGSPESWLTFNLIFVLAVSGLLNILLVLRLALR